MRMNADDNDDDDDWIGCQRRRYVIISLKLKLIAVRTMITPIRAGCSLLACPPAYLGIYSLLWLERRAFSICNSNVAFRFNVPHLELHNATEFIHSFDRPGMGI